MLHVQQHILGGTYTERKWKEERWKNENPEFPDSLITIFTTT